MKICAFFVGLLLAVSTTSAVAAGPYIGASGGISVIHDSDIKVTGYDVTATASYETGYGFNL